MQMESRNQLESNLQSAANSLTPVSDRKSQDSSKCPDGVCEVNWKPGKSTSSDSSKARNLSPLSK